MSDATKAYGILATGTYLPRLRLQRSAVVEQHQWMTQGLKGLAKGGRAFGSWDEDVVTMAVEAGRAVLADRACAPIDELTLVSTTFPFADRSNAGIVAAALGLPDHALTVDAASSARSAATELVRLLAKPTAGEKLLVAAERRTARPASPQELIFGDGAAGAVVGQGEPLATLLASQVRNADFIDHFRESGRPYEYGWEERWVRDEGYLKLLARTLSDCLAVAGVKPAQIARFVLPAPVPRINDAVAKKLGIGSAAVVDAGFESAGDLGSAQVLRMLDQALRAAAEGELVLVAAFGSGGAALLLRRTGKAPAPAQPAATRAETSYLKFLSFSGQLAPDWGMRAEMDTKTALTAAYREAGAIARLEAGRCAACGTVQFPRSRVCVNPRCVATDTQVPKSLVDVPARVLSHTSDFLGYTPAPPFQFGHVDFEGGGRILMEFADTDPDELRSGLPVRMVFRVKDLDPRRGFRRYFWKATPVRPAASQGAIDG
jgi:3-hydroxy-3-methylglutaryl CoA synthase/uncharacterized OB-fold protein